MRVLTWASGGTVDTPVLGTGSARSVGSNPISPTNRAAIVKWYNRVLVMLSRKFDSRWWHHISTQYTVDQLVDRTTGCSKIKLERRKRFFLLNRGKKTVSPRTLFINTQPQGG